MTRTYKTKKTTTLPFELAMLSGVIIRGVLYPAHAPNTVGNFIHLANSGYYDQSCFHRCISGFIAQGGKGNPPLDYCINGEFDFNSFKKNRLHHEYGSLSMARTRHYCSASSEFFFVTSQSEKQWLQLDGAYAVFGKVTEGMEELSTIASVPTDNMICPI